MCINTFDTPLVIRTAEIEDLKQVKAIDQSLFKEDSYPVFALRQLLDITNGLMKVAVLEDKIVGYIIGHHNRDEQEAWFLSLGVLPHYRGNKIGEGLTVALTEDVAERGAKDIFLTVHPENKPGRSLYNKLGFKNHQTSEDYYLDGLPRLIMKMSLSERLN